MNKFVFLLFVLFAVAGCATNGPTADGSIIERGEKPVVGVSSIARVGDEIFEEYNLIRTKFPSTATLSMPVNEKVKLLFVPAASIVAPAGAQLLHSGEGKYCSSEKFYIDPIGGPFAPVCFSDSDGDGEFESVRPKATSSSSLVGVSSAKLTPPIPYREAGAGKFAIPAGGYKKTTLVPRP